MKVSYEKDSYEVKSLSYEQLFKLSAKLIEKHDKIEKINLDIKNYIDFLEISNETLRYANIRNQASNYETRVSIKKEVKYIHKTLSKFTKGEVNLYLILSNQIHSLNKTWLCFKSSRTHSKGFNMKKVNRPIYKCSVCNNLCHI